MKHRDLLPSSDELYIRQAKPCPQRSVNRNNPMSLPKKLAHRHVKVAAVNVEPLPTLFYRDVRVAVVNVEPLPTAM